MARLVLPASLAIPGRRLPLRVADLPAPYRFGGTVRELRVFLAGLRQRMAAEILTAAE